MNTLLVLLMFNCIPNHRAYEMECLRDFQEDPQSNVCEARQCYLEFDPKLGMLIVYGEGESK